jgi:hypothetical protein
LDLKQVPDIAHLVDDCSRRGNVYLLNTILGYLLGFNKVPIWRWNLWYTVRSVDGASANGHVHVLDWWLQVTRKYDLPLRYTYRALNKASKNDHIKVLEWWETLYIQSEGVLLVHDMGEYFNKLSPPVVQWWYRMTNKYERGRLGRVGRLGLGPSYIEEWNFYPASQLKMCKDK